MLPLEEIGRANGRVTERVVVNHSMPQEPPLAVQLEDADGIHRRHKVAPMEVSQRDTEGHRPA